MSEFEVPDPIVCSPYLEPQQHWHIEEGVPPELRPGRRPSVYFQPGDGADATGGTAVPLLLVPLVRERLQQWRADGYAGTTRTTRELLDYWRRDGRQHRLFFAQIEAAETIIFLNEARRDYLQGVDVPSDEPSERQKEELGYRSFHRYACKMATGSGKTTVMGMLAAWSILNKVHDRGNACYSDLVLIVCPNVTIGINFCVDLSATPYFLGRVGQDANRPFPWVVSDFSLTDAIESGLVKIPQLAVRDTTGSEIPGYFNIWRWIMPQLTPAERGGRKGSPKPEAILKFANTPISMSLGQRPSGRYQIRVERVSREGSTLLVQATNSCRVRVPL